METKNLLFGEGVLASAAQGADKIVGEFVKLHAGLNAVVGIAQSFVINPTANIANVLFHSKYLLICYILESLDSCFSLCEYYNVALMIWLLRMQQTDKILKNFMTDKRTACALALVRDKR